MIHSKVKELPESVQTALASIGCHCADISVEAKERVDPGYVGGAGRRGFCIIINMATGERKTLVGSWGGSNMFSPDNQVDNDRTQYPIPNGFCVLKGSVGYPRTFCNMYVSPENMVKFLPARVELDPRDRWLLYTFDALTSAGRKDEWRRTGDNPSEDDLNRLAKLGYLKRSKAGSAARTRITTEGKNALGRKVGETIMHPNRKW